MNPMSKTEKEMIQENIEPGGEFSMYLFDHLFYGI
jgi:hypothetical protein